MRHLFASLFLVCVLFSCANPLALKQRAPEDIPPGELISKILVGLINNNKIIPTNIPIHQSFSGISFDEVEFSEHPTVLALNITNLRRNAEDSVIAGAFISVSFAYVILNTSLGAVDIGNTSVSLSIDLIQLQVPCSSSTVPSQVNAITLSNLKVINPSTDWVIQLVVKIINTNSFLAALISKVIPLPISFPLPPQAQVICILPIDGGLAKPLVKSASVALTTPVTSPDVSPSQFLIDLLNQVIKSKANDTISIGGCTGSLVQINFCDTETKTAQDDGAARIACQAGCDTAYGACIVGTNICWGPCYAACKIVPWCNANDCDSKCGRTQCGNVRDGCMTDCTNKLTWHGGAGLDSISGIADSLKVLNLNHDDATDLWTIQLAVAPTVRMKFFCDPVVPSWQYASTGLGDWTVSLSFKLGCSASAPGKIYQFNFGDWNLSGFNVQVISGIFGSFQNVPGFSQLMNMANDAVQNAISGKVSPLLRDALEQGLQALCPIDTQGILCQTSSLRLLE